MISTHEAFKKFRSRLELNQREQEDASRRQKRVRAVMDKAFAINWLRVLGTTETPQIDQRVCHQFHPVVALLDVLKTEE